MAVSGRVVGSKSSAVAAEAVDQQEGAGTGESCQAYLGKRLTVVHNTALCAHVGECERAPGGVFEANRTPWCQPDSKTATASVDEATGQLAQVLSRCPTGALSARDNLGEPLLEAAGPNQIAVANDGPLYFRGHLVLSDARMDAPALARRMALCRCGHTKNRPHCDGSHRKCGFRDAGAVGSAGPGQGGRFAGSLVIKPLPGGPLIIKGNFALIAGTGRVAWTGQSTALCRCGRSGNKPFCDGSHSEPAASKP